MNKIIRLILCLLLYISSAFAQGEGNHWYFGYNAGLDFTSGSPVADINGSLNTWEGCSSVSDKNGNLLFYTDGGSVYSRNHAIMPNGTGLLGNNSSTQSAIIVRKPGSDSLYYIFTTPQVSTGGFYYSIVDLSLNGGQGDIIVSSKNTNLLPVVGERVTATKHSNGVYTWIITKPTNTNSYYAFLLDCSGVQAPVITSIGLNANGVNAGSTVASPNGKKVASTYFSSANAIEILDFDNSTGIFSNPITSSEGAYPYGACFSPNSNLFYYSNISNGNLYQLDLTAGTGSATDVLASETVVGNAPAVGPFGFRAGNLQLSANGKMYMAENGQANISVINSPNTAGVGCNFVLDAVNLGGKTCGLGLPAFFLNFVDTTVIDYLHTCLNLATQFSLHSDSTGVDSVHWNFGDIPSGTNNSSSLFSPSHLFSSTGIYNVQLIRYFLCGTDTNSISVTIVPNLVTASIVGNDSICFDETLQLSASGGLTYNWSGPNNFSDTAANVTINNIQNPGIYSVIAADSHGCTDTAQNNITVFPKPIAIANSNSPIVIGTTINLSTDTTSGISWSGPNSFANTQQNPTITNAQQINSGTYQIIKTNTWGCKDTATTNVYVYQPEIPDNTIDDDGDGLIDCADPDLATLHQCYKCGYDSIAWKTVNPETGFNKAIAVKYTGVDQFFVVPVGVTSIKIKAWGAGGGGSFYSGQNAGGGAGAYVEGNLNVTANQAFSLMVGEGGVCDGNTDNASYGFGGSYGSVAVGGFGGGLSGVFTVGNPITAIDQSRALLIAGGGGAGERAAPSNFCSSGGQGGDPSFGGGMTTMQGENGNPKTGGGGGGGYFGGLMSQRLSGTVSLYAGEGGTSFIHSSIIGGTSLFSSDFGNWNTFPALYKNPPNTNDPHYEGFVSSTNPGIGTGSMYTYAKAGDGRIVIQWFEPIEDLTIIASKDTICKGDTLSLTAIGQSSYFWSPSATLSSDTAKTTIAQPTMDITYKVISNVNNCKDTAQISIKVNQLPILTLTNDTAICSGKSLVLNVSGANTYSWSPANNLNSTTGSFVITNTTTNQKYFVNGTDNNGCTSNDSVSITIDSLPIPVLSGTTAFCLGDSTTINISGGNHYLWSNGDTNTFIRVAPTINTAYSVIVKNSFNCLDSATFNTIVHAIPVPGFNFNYVCNGSNTLFNNISSINASDTIQTYTWNFGDPSPLDNNQNPSHVYALDSSYHVVLTAISNFGCTDSITKTVVVNPNPIVFFTADDSLGCAQLCVNFSDSSTIHNGTNTQWTWNFGDTSPTDNAQNPNHCYNNNTAPASYTVTLTVTSDSGCVTSFTKTNYITVHPNPTAIFTANNVCLGNNVLFNQLSIVPATDAIVSWAWNLGDGSAINNNQNIAGGYLYDSAATYITSLLVTTNAGCKDSITHTISVNPNPTANFTISDTAGCEPLCISFLDASSINTGSDISQWIWNVGDGSTINSSPSFEHCYNNDSISTPILFSLSLTAVSDSGCTNTINKNNYITIYPISIANFSASPTTIDISNPLINITNLSVNADSNHWYFGDNQIDTTIAPNTHVYSDTGTYTITLITNTSFGCADTTYQTIIIQPDFMLYIPSAFSPNEDGINDTFIAKGDFIKEFEMDIFDRWGNLIYKTNDITKPWNGKVKNGTDAAQTDVYVYSIKATDFKDSKHSFRGKVTLLK